MLLLLVFAYPILSILIDNFSQSPENELYMAGTKTIAINLKQLPLIDIDTVTNGLEIVNNINLMIRTINEAFRTDFPELNVNDLTVVSNLQELVPFVDPYNDLIKSARNYDENNPETAKPLIMNCYMLGFNVIVLEGKITYSIAFKTTGLINNLLKLGKLRGIVGDTLYSEFLSRIYWFIGDKLTNLPNDLKNIIEETLRRIS